MRRSLTLAALMLLVFPFPALAKEPRSAKVCGTGSCREVKDRSLLMPIIEGGAPTDPPSRPRPWYGVEITVAEKSQFDHFEVSVVPGARLVRGEDATWMRLTDPARRVYAHVTRGISPYPADEMPGPVAEAVAPPRESSGVDTPAWPWVAGGVLALMAAAGLLRRRRRSS